MLGFWGMGERQSRRESGMGGAVGTWAAVPLLVALGFVVTGCASPGRPMPPSLEAPKIVTDLTAARSGDEVRLQWTTPGRTTDGVAIQGTVTAEICLDLVAGVPGRGPQACDISKELAVRPGRSEAVARLSADLASGGPRLVMYRVQLRGRTGKTAGPSAAAYVAAGEAPEPVRGLKATDAKAGAVLEWTPGQPGIVELERRAEAAPATAKPAGGAPVKAGGVAGKGLDALLQRGRGGAAGAGDSGLVRLSGGPSDAGGVIDRTAEMGRTYHYSAQRVRTVEIAGKSLEVRSVTSNVVTLAMREVFPPEVPVGLVAAPGPGSIDLSWDPGAEPGRLGESAVTVVGFRVYRKDEGGGDWGSLTVALVAAPAYRDTAAQAGRRYRYRVTAVDASGHESAPSGEVIEGLEP